MPGLKDEVAGEEGMVLGGRGNSLAWTCSVLA
jgi:hypothetical protein